MSRSERRRLTAWIGRNWERMTPEQQAEATAAVVGYDGAAAALLEWHQTDDRGFLTEMATLVVVDARLALARRRLRRIKEEVCVREYCSHCGAPVEGYHGPCEP